MLKLESSLLAWLDRHKQWLYLLMISALAMLIRLQFLDIQSIDYKVFLQHWFAELQANGGFKALANPVGNYNIPYLIIMAALTYLPIPPLYSLKLVSILFDFVGATFAALIVCRMSADSPRRALLGCLTYTLVILAPTVMLNSAAWAQCDFIYTSFLLMSLYYLLGQRYLLAFIAYGVAFSFKLQAIFLFPLLVLLYLVNREFSILHFLLIPLVNLLLSLPALIAGYPFKALLLIYFNQTQSFKKLALNFPSVYNLLPDNYDLFQVPGILFTVAVLGLFTFTVWATHQRISRQQLISYALWLVMATTFFLPNMHDRYLFIADVLSLVYLVIRRQDWPLPLFINLASLGCYVNFLFVRGFVPMQPIAGLFLVILSYFTVQLFREMRREQTSAPLPANA